MNINTAWVFIVIILPAWVSSAFLTSSTGTCPQLSDGEEVQCAPLSDCHPRYLKNIATRIKSLQICGIQKQKPLICCPSNKSRPPEGAAVPLSVAEYSSESTKSIPTSQRKCREYAKLVYDGQDKKNEKCTINPEQIFAGKTRKGHKNGKAAVGEFPHMAAILRPSVEDGQSLEFICGGSLISEKFVLTAAVCLNPGVGSRRSTSLAEWVRMGALGTVDPFDSGQLIAITQIIRHPDYIPEKFYFDIGLVQLKKSPQLGPFVRPACLPTDDEDFSSRELIITGWGENPIKGVNVSSALLKATVFESPYRICNAYYGSELRLGVHNESMVCAGHPIASTSSTQGDGGGPIQAISADPHCTYKIVGITSLGMPPKNNTSVPTVYSRVQYFRRWIENVVWN